MSNGPKITTEELRKAVRLYVPEWDEYLYPGDSIGWYPQKALLNILDDYDALILCLGEAKRNMERHSVVTAQEEAI